MLGHVECPVGSGCSGKDVSLAALSYCGHLQQRTLPSLSRVVHDKAVTPSSHRLPALWRRDQVPRRGVAVGPVGMTRVR